eukprot:GHRR01009166.1.p4 GENE.GHRR01009166.1~~GHRR01009166.1.p4  ORF type:complete len:135 (-),score=35.10 GHRR01009166.1:2488-2892(-)
MCTTLQGSCYLGHLHGTTVALWPLCGCGHTTDMQCPYWLHLMVSGAKQQGKPGVLVRVSALQAENPTPASTLADDDSVIDRLVAQLQAATQGLPAAFRLQPVHFEKVGPLLLVGWLAEQACRNVIAAHRAGTHV